MIVRKLRLQRGWSQEQLSEMSGLSVRTIQRIERSGNGGLESLKALASVFEIQVSDLQKTPEPDMTEVNENVKLTQEEERVLTHVQNVKGFYTHAIWYVIVIGGLFIFNYVSEPSYIWAWWPAMGWGIGLLTHAINVFELINFFGPEWERKQVEKRLGRKL